MTTLVAPNFSPAADRESILAEVLSERERQINIGNGNADQDWSVNDWVAYITAYAGRAAQNVIRNEREGNDSRQRLIQVAALAVAAVEALDRKVK